MLKKGDPCYVRLFSGEIVEATYDFDGNDREHFVRLKNGKRAIASKDITEDKSAGILDCRFVCMTGPNKEKENG